MPEQPDESPFTESHLESPQYRERLMRKLNCLIALLEVAMARVRRSLAAPEPDVERLARIRSNLQNTLDVCLRARNALERREALPLRLPDAAARAEEAPSRAERPIAELRDVLKPMRRRLTAGARREMSSQEEVRKFERLGRIDPREVRRCDIEELARRLQGS